MVEWVKVAEYQHMMVWIRVKLPKTVVMVGEEEEVGDPYGYQKWELILGMRNW